MRNYVNLLPLKHRRAVLLRNLLAQWCAVWAVAIVVMVGVVWLNRSYHVRTVAAVSAREIACLPVTTTAKENHRMREEIRRFDRRETLAGQLGNDKPALCLLAAVSKSAQLCDGHVVVRDLQFAQRSDTPPRGIVPASNVQEPASEAEASLTIEGDALDNLAIARFAAALRDSSLFRDVELKSSVGKPSASQPVHSFVVRCDI